MSWRGRALAIVLGLLVGVGIVTLFVFEFSEQAVDDPSLSGGEEEQSEPEEDARREPERKAGPAKATVQIVGGAPPQSGPAQVTVERRQRVKLELVSDAPVGVQLTGYGISRTVPAGKSTIEFKAKKTGNFPLIVSASHITVATINVSR